MYLRKIAINLFKNALIVLVSDRKLLIARAKPIVATVEKTPYFDLHKEKAIFSTDVSSYGTQSYLLCRHGIN